MLNLEEQRHENGEKVLTAFGMTEVLTKLRHDGEHEWLNEVAYATLQRECNDLYAAYQRFFRKKAKHPKFKSKKKSEIRFPVGSTSKEFYFKNDKELNIVKIGKVRYKTDFKFPTGYMTCRFSNVRVYQDNKKWFVSFTMERENQTSMLTDKVMGIDLGVKELAVAAVDGEELVYHNINKSEKMRRLNKRLKHIQRGIARKYEANRVGKKYVKTNNIVREEAKLRKLYRRIANIRNNYLHQTTHALVSKLPKRVVMEGLNVQGMMKNKHISRAVGEQCFSEFIRQMRYKCEWNGIEFVQADRFFPSSRICCRCGNVKHDLKLSDRVYLCKECGLEIDRDFNAAINLSRYIA